MPSFSRVLFLLIPELCRACHCQYPVLKTLHGIFVPTHLAGISMPMAVDSTANKKDVDSDRSHSQGQYLSNTPLPGTP